MKLLQALVLVILFAEAAPAQSVPEARPNLAVHVSGQLVNALIERPVDQTDPIEEVINGTMYYGLGRTLGQVRAELVPDPCRGSFELVMTGTTYTDTLGFRMAYQARTHTRIPFEVRKRLAIDGRQIYSSPATASAAAESEILGLAHEGKTGFSLRMLMGCCMAYHNKEDSERETAYKARCRLAAEFDKDVNAELVRGHRTLADALEAVRKLGFQPRPFEWSTTADHVGVKITLPAPGQLPVSSGPPTPPKAADLTVSAHPSLIELRVQKSLGGKTFNVLELGEALRKWLGSVDEGIATNLIRMGELHRLLQELKLKPIPITFAERRPLTIALGDKGFTLVLHAAGFKEGDRTYPAADIRAVYRIEKNPTCFAAVRQGGVQIVAPPGSSTTPDAVLRAQLQLLFNLLIMDRLALDNFPLPLSQGSKASRLVASQAILKDGWLQLSWVRKED